MADYNFKDIENKWKYRWVEDNVYEAVDFSPKPKKYILAELPYPSGKFLHIGHMMRYTVPEIYSRFLRMRGYNVLYPMGWDSFGLPAETFAIKEGITPQEAIQKATKDYKKAMIDMGYAIDWKREINTSDPLYYKWTQWTFIKLWEKGLAVQKEMPVWWCKELGVLADEEVLTDKDGNKISERGGYKVERKMFKQWVLKIPEYADRLLEDLKDVDYSQAIKDAQINWIGKKEGDLVNFAIGNNLVEVFTTRADTIFGVSFLAISPDHPVVSNLLEIAENDEEIKKYVEKSKKLTDLEKQTKEKTGVLVKGISAKHPFDEIERKIPVYIADYILMDYGTGAVMGVPAHDERDNEFAQKYNLEIIEVIKPSGNSTDTQLLYAEFGVLVNSGKYDGLSSEEAINQVTARLQKENKGKPHKTYKMRDQVFSRQRYWGEPIPLIYRQDGTLDAVKELPLELPVLKDFLPGEDGSAPLNKAEDWVNTVDSERKPARRETDTMPTWAGSNWYFLSYIDPYNDKVLADYEKLKYWLPVDKYFGDAGHTTVHLLYSRFWHKFLYDLNVVPVNEPYKWRMSGGLLLGPDGHKMSKSRGNVIDPKNVIDNYGADAARVYLSFIGPYEDTYPWNDNGIKATFRFLTTVYSLSSKVQKDLPEDAELKKQLHKLIKNVTSMVENLKMNTSVSELMIFINHAKKRQFINEEIWKDFLKVLAPFAPFITEELWQEVNDYKEWKKENSIHLQPWPKYDESLVAEKEFTVPVQINGKIKAQIVVTTEDTEEIVKEKALTHASISEAIKSKEIKKIVYVPGKIISLQVE